MTLFWGQKEGERSCTTSGQSIKSLARKSSMTGVATGTPSTPQERELHSQVWANSAAWQPLLQTEAQKLGLLTKSEGASVSAGKLQRNTGRWRRQFSGRHCSFRSLWWVQLPTNRYIKMKPYKGTCPCFRNATNSTSPEEPLPTPTVNNSGDNISFSQTV